MGVKRIGGDRVDALLSRILHEFIHVGNFVIDCFRWDIHKRKIHGSFFWENIFFRDVTHMFFNIS